MKLMVSGERRAPFWLRLGIWLHISNKLTRTWAVAPQHGELCEGQLSLPACGYPHPPPPVHPEGLRPGSAPSSKPPVARTRVWACTGV